VYSCTARERTDRAGKQAACLEQLRSPMDANVTRRLRAWAHTATDFNREERTDIILVVEFPMADRMNFLCGRGGDFCHDTRCWRPTCTSARIKLLVTWILRLYASNARRKTCAHFGQIIEEWEFSRRPDKILYYNSSSLRAGTQCERRVRKSEHTAEYFHVCGDS